MFIWVVKCWLTLGVCLDIAFDCFDCLFAYCDVGMVCIVGFVVLCFVCFRVYLFELFSFSLFVAVIWLFGCLLVLFWLFGAVLGVVCFIVIWGLLFVGILFRLRVLMFFVFGIWFNFLSFGWLVLFVCFLVACFFILKFMFVFWFDSWFKFVAVDGCRIVSFVIFNWWFLMFVIIY